MTVHNTELLQRLVVGRKRDGRNCYDPDAKRELIEACLQPGVSVARMAMQHGVNANLLRIWICRYRKRQESGMMTPSAYPAFVPVIPARVLAGRPGLLATLPNGVKLDLGGMEGGALAAVLNSLAQLPCSALTQD